MNKYDGEFIFRKARKNDLCNIAQFFDQVWKKGSILSNVEFLGYEFAGKGDEINIILAVHKQTGEIQGLWCYYPFSAEGNTLDVAGGPWCVKQDRNSIPFLGNEIMVRAEEIIGYRTMLGIGDNKNTSGFYHRRFRRDVVGRLSQYYMLNCNREFKIAIINQVPEAARKSAEIPKFDVRMLNSMEDIEEGFWKRLDKDRIPYKDKGYVEKRFFEHPVYQYYALGAYSHSQLQAILFMRSIAMNNSKVNRIVDYLGNKECIVGFGNYLKRYMEENEYEYTDFYNYGFDGSLMIEAGFAERKENDPNIVPNYFEPFVQENIEIFFSSPVSDVTLCKADGDQDRPNYIRRG